jgi:zinc protease
MLKQKTDLLRLFTMVSVLVLCVLSARSGFASRDNGFVARPEQLVYSSSKFTPPQPQHYKHQLVNEVSSYLVESHETHLVNLQLLSRAGQYLEPVGKEGVAQLYQQLLWNSGSGSLNADQQAEALDAIAAKYSVSVGRDFSQLTLNVPAEDLERGMELMKMALSSPLYQQDRIELAKLKLIQSLNQRNDKLMPLSVRENRRLVYGEHSFVNRLPTEESVRSITKKDLLDFHRKVFHPQSLVISANGHFHVPDLKNKLNHLLVDWPAEPMASSYVFPNDMKSSPAGVYLYDKKNERQAMALLTFPGVRRDDPDYYSLSILNNIYGGGGFTSRLMSSLREKHGLTYGASSYLYSPDLFNGLILSNFDIEAENTKTALGLYFKEWERITTDLVLESELSVAKENILTQYEKKFSTKEKLAFQLAYDDMFGRDTTEYENFHSRVHAVTRENVLQMAKKYFDLNRLIVMLVGDVDKIELPDRVKKLRVTLLAQRNPLTLKEER